MAMKAEDLFVCALVRVNHDGLCIKKGTIVEVRGVDADDRLAKKGLVGSAHCRPLDDDQFEGGIWCEYLEPIPLTPEILEKNGFEICNEDTDGAIQYECGSPALGIDIWINTKPCLLGAWRTWDGETKSYTMVEELPINYVHELQHCLKLVDIEKEIEL